MLKKGRDLFLPVRNIFFFKDSQRGIICLLSVIKKLIIEFTKRNRDLARIYKISVKGSPYRGMTAVFSVFRS